MAIDPTDAFTRVWDFIDDIWALIITILVEDLFLTVGWNLFVDLFGGGLLSSAWGFALMLSIFLYMFHRKYIGGR